MKWLKLILEVLMTVFLKRNADIRKGQDSEKLKQMEAENETLSKQRDSNIGSVADADSMFRRAREERDRDS